MTEGQQQLHTTMASGGQLISVASICVLLLGITQLVSSGLVLDNSSGSDPGGLYVGLICVVVGLRGINPIIDKTHSAWFFGYCVFAVVASIIGVIFQSMFSAQIHSLRACMNEDNVVRYGNSNYYSALSRCNADKACTCIDNSNQCISFSTFDSTRCFNLLNTLPGLTEASLNLTIVCLVFTFFLSVISFISWKYPPHLSYFNFGTEDRETFDPDNHPSYWWVKYMHFCSEDDDGVPFFCNNRYCPLDHRNKLTNDNSIVRYIGPFGYEYFDVNRRFYLGLASIFTIFAMFLTIWGCFALSTNSSIVQRTYWAAGTGINSTSQEYFSMYVGLRSLEYVNCVFVPGYNSYPSNCALQTIAYSSSECISGPVAEACTACSNSASAMWATAFMSCASMILSLAGAQTRMRNKADVPVQKLLGMFSELWGALSLAVALFIFQDKCFHQLHTTFNAKVLTTTFWVGPGLYCYAVCCISGIVLCVIYLCLKEVCDVCQV